MPPLIKLVGLGNLIIRLQVPSTSAGRQLGANKKIFVYL